MTPRQSSKKRSRPTFIEQARRSQIVAAAREKILEKGFENATIAEIANAIDVSKGVILYHFDNKSELGKAVIEDILESYGSHIVDELEKRSTAIEKLLDFPVVCAKYFERRQAEFLLYVDTLGSFASINEKRDYMAQANQKQREFLVQIVKQAKKEGSISAVKPEPIADTIQAFVDGINSQYCSDPKAVKPTECAELFKSLLGNSLKS